MSRLQVAQRMGGESVGRTRRAPSSRARGTGPQTPLMPPAHPDAFNADSAPSQLERALEIWKTNGLLNLLTRLVKRALRPVIDITRCIFFATDLNKPLRTLTARIPLDVRPATPADAREFAKAFQEGGLDQREIQKRLDRGHACILAFSGGQLIHFQWISFNSSTWISDLGVNILLNPGEAYVYDVVTLPAWRGYGVHPAVSSFGDRYWHLHGCNRVFSFVQAHNAPSLRAVEKLGRKRSKTLWVIRIARMKNPFILGAMRAGPPLLTLRVNEPSTRATPDSPQSEAAGAVKTPTA